MDTFKQMFYSLTQDEQYSQAIDLAETAYRSGVIDVGTLVTAVNRCNWEAGPFDNEHDFVEFILWGGNL